MTAMLKGSAVSERTARWFCVGARGSVWLTNIYTPSTQKVSRLYDTVLAEWIITQDNNNINNLMPVGDNYRPS